MSKRINLLVHRKKAGISGQLEQSIKMGGTALGILLFLTFVYFVVVQFFLVQEHESLLRQKADILGYINANRVFEGKVSFMSTKISQLKTDLKDDAEFLPYYYVLDNAVRSASRGASLETMSIDKDKNTQFTLRFNGLPTAYLFIKYVETEEFLNNFSELKLSNLSLLQAEGAISKNYQLSFTGKFKLLSNEETTQ
ncbi:hypothetical protein HGA88_04965 [Candidatus Roizmanbacteria bacterium]|nr:hypothetical protein [Candidatus Roizmanbacteria bacterium]